MHLKIEKETQNFCLARVRQCKVEIGGTDPPDPAPEHKTIVRCVLRYTEAATLPIKEEAGYKKNMLGHLENDEFRGHVRCFERGEKYKFRNHIRKQLATTFDKSLEDLCRPALLFSMYECNNTVCMFAYRLFFI